MAAAVSVERLLDAVELRCAFCLQFLSDPVLLAGCAHSFCRACLLPLCRGKLRACCPLCRQGFQQKDLRPNRELAALVSLVSEVVKEEELETRDETKPCSDGSSVGRRPQEKEYASQIRRQITEDFCRMREYVDRQERNTLMLIEQEQKAAQKKTEGTIHQLCGEANKLTDIKAQMNNSPERERYKGAPSTKPKMTLDEKLNVVKTAVEDLKRKLEILLLGYAQQFPPVQPPDLYQETSVCSLSPVSAARNPEPMISSQISQWAADVAFDVGRINKHLVITAQNRTVMVSSSPIDYEPSPKRFCISQVMCSQSFSAGCHYWEVITKESDGWAVGVAHEMIGKRDRLGRTEHSWCVEWLGPKKQLSAWHRNQETLLHRDKPLKVGVFLELQRKTVSFYSITDKEMLLHTFEITTSNPLYPACWLYGLERNGSLTLSHTNRR
uniref:E3 ubiquitin-protein ligase RNF135 n=1 Tax=Calidris pygmaea TaxID=425635 RepID=A0A8C3J058_9CHAR